MTKLFTVSFLVSLGAVAQAETLTLDRSIADGAKVDVTTNVEDRDGNWRVDRTKDASCFQQRSILHLDTLTGAFELFVKGRDQRQHTRVDRSHTKDVAEDGVVFETWSSVEITTASRSSWTVKVRN